MTTLFSRPFCSCSFHTFNTPKLTLLGQVLCLVGTFAGLEFIVGHMSHSLSLQADSGHMLSDGLALAIALLAAWVARHSSISKPSNPVSWQIEAWAALVNGLGLVGMAGLIAWEAYRHWQAPPTEILSVPMLITAIVGLVVNGLSLQWLQTFHRSEQLDDSQEPDLNVQGAFLHVLADVLGSVGVILAAIAVWTWGWTWADNVISVCLALLIGGSAIPLIQKSLRQLRSSPRKLPSSPSAATSLSQKGVNRLTDLNKMGFYEIGQTPLHTMIMNEPSLDAQTLGAQSTRPKNTHNQPQANKTGGNK